MIAVPSAARMPSSGEPAPGEHGDHPAEEVHRRDREVELARDDRDPERERDEAVRGEVLEDVVDVRRAHRVVRDHRQQREHHDHHRRGSRTARHRRRADGDAVVLGRAHRLRSLQVRQHDDHDDDDPADEDLPARRVAAQEQHVGDRRDEDRARGRPRDRPAPAGDRVAADERGGDRVVRVAPGEEQRGVRARRADQDPRARRVERGDPERADGEQRDRQRGRAGGDAVLAEQVDLAAEPRPAHHDRQHDRDDDEDVDRGRQPEHRAARGAPSSSRRPAGRCSAPCESQTAMPSISPAAPIVMMIGFAPQAPTAKPCTAPIARPSSSVRTIAAARPKRSE